ncbi:hypothetical protein GCM10007111_28890 [Virgibacillus kapii]|uniref:Uncharacterized protein n=1 Tax=Virgibacillus kapii TaxID=1638645 RepID=A0ABQ2DNB7_9BACI|nr:hypothetical protein GCM10007111_28890 [Virgibacillus kapii]
MQKWMIHLDLGWTPYDTDNAISNLVIKTRTRRAYHEQRGSVKFDPLCFPSKLLCCIATIN